MTQVFEGVVAVPTRGMLMTEVFEGIIRNIVPRTLSQRFWTVRTTWDKPIPDAQNDVMAEAIKMAPDFIWMVEEDTVPRHGILTHMIQMDSLVVVADYNLEIQGQRSVQLFKNSDRVYYGGIGCMLVRRKVFDMLKIPWFEIGHWSPCGNGEFSHYSGRPKYGTQDTSFFVRLSEAGIRARYAGDSWKCRHLRLEELGDRGVNNGLHKICEL